MTPENRELVQAIACELLARSASTLPPPADIEAERLVVAGLFCGACPEDVTLRREDFSSKLLGAVYEMARLLRAEGMRVAVEPILVALREQGWAGPIEVELLRVRDGVPSVSRLDLEESAAWIVELAERRRLLARCESLASRLRCGECDSTDAMQELQGAWNAA